MRFAAAAVALAGAVIAHEAESTVYSTEYLTITSCAPTVTNCPARSTVVTSSVIPMTTSTIFSTTTRTVTQCPDTVSHCPAESTTVVTDTIAVSTTVCPVTAAQPTSTPSASMVVSSGSPVPTGPGSIIPPFPTTTLASVAPACPTVSVKTIKTSVTTVIPTIIYETVQVPCATSAASPPASTPSSVPTGTNPGGPIATAGAATMGGSALLAVAAGLVALFA